VKRIPIIISAALLFLNIIGCSPRLASTEGSLELTVSNLCEQSEVIKALIINGEYQRFYQEIFSPELQEDVNLESFQTRLNSLSENYGALKSRLSGMESCIQLSGSQYLLRYVFQYKERTVFTEFMFAEQDSSDNPVVLLSYYEFTDE